MLPEVKAYSFPLSFKGLIDVGRLLHAPLPTHVFLVSFYAFLRMK